MSEPIDLSKNSVGAMRFDATTPLPCGGTVLRAVYGISKSAGGVVAIDHYVCDECEGPAS